MKRSLPRPRSLKRLILAVALLLLLAAPAASLAAGGVQFDPLEVFQGRVGNIGFALPGMPLVIHEADVKDFWTDSTQLNGNCGIDGCEYQLHIADISPLIDTKNKENPDAAEGENQMAALLDYASFYIRYYDGAIEDVRSDPEQGLLTFRYSYPDSPGVSYSSKCYLANSTAVCLMAEECEHNEKALSLLKPMTQEERQAYLARTPDIIDFMGISMLFPYSPYVFTDDQGVTMAFCFAKDYTRIIAQYLPVSMDMELDEETMEKLAKRLAGTLGEEDINILDGVLAGNEELRQYDFTFQSSLGNGEYLQEKWDGRVYASESGIWYLLASDGEIAQQLMKSCDLSAETPERSYSGLWVEAEAIQARERDPEPAPSSLRPFLKDLRNLLESGEYHEIISADDLQLGNAFWSDGRWTRTLTIGSPELFAVLVMSSEEKNAVVNEIHIICGEEIDYRYGSYFSACCAKAAEGTAEDGTLDGFVHNAEPDLTFAWTGKRYRADNAYVDRSDFHYYRMTVTANAPADVRPVTGEWVFGQLTDSGAMTIQEFCDGWEQINQTLYANMFPLTAGETMQADDGQELHMLMFGDSSVITLVCNPDGLERISGINIMNFEEFPPQTFLGGLLSLAVITRMPMDELVRMTLMLQEYPLWEDLNNMDPVAGWNGKALVLSDDEYNGQYIPIGYIVSFPEE